MTGGFYEFDLEKWGYETSGSHRGVSNSPPFGGGSGAEFVEYDGLADASFTEIGVGEPRVGWAGCERCRGSV
jgi:hypothetical protein